MVTAAPTMNAAGVLALNRTSAVVPLRVKVEITVVVTPTLAAGDAPSTAGLVGPTTTEYEKVVAVSSVMA